MPTYEYECRPNGHRFEVKQSFSDDPIETCQVCGEPVRKVFSAAGIVFKGSGYYVTDTRPKPKSETSKAGGQGKEKTSASSDSSGSSSESSKSAGSGSTSSSGSSDTSSAG